MACIRDLRVTVTLASGQLAAGQTREQILADYPYLGAEDITAGSSSGLRGSASERSR